MKRYLTPLNLVFAIEVLTVAAVSLGFIPREAVLFLTGLMVFYMIFSPVEDGLYLTIMSIPLFVALPISDNFDSMANWRILIVILFLCLFFKKGILLNLMKDKAGRWYLRENLKRGLLKYLTLVFLLAAALSILVADYKVLAIKKLLFLINIFILFLIIKNLARNREVIFNILKAGATGGIVVLLVALIQFITALFIPLYTLWQFWAGKVIAAFYGQNLAYLLSYSNTWFAYYAKNPPTLRLFSVFPDSHSFAIFCLLMIPIFLSLALFLKDNKTKNFFFWVLTVFSLVGIVLSGSRGAWLSAVPVIALMLYIYRKKIEPALARKALLTAAIFILVFLFSIGYPSLLYKFQSWQGSNASTTFSFFERAKSISDTEDISNKGRIEIWRASAKSLINYPFLGVGLGNYVTVLNENVSAAKKGASAHNLYLDFAAEIGIFGALILIAIFIEVLRSCWLVFRRAQEPYFKIFGLLFGLYFLWVMAYSLFDVVLLNDKVLLFFMVGLALLYSVRSLIEKEKADLQRAT